MYEKDGEEIFVIDGHVHLWDARQENIIHEGASSSSSVSTITIPGSPRRRNSGTSTSTATTAPTA